MATCILRVDGLSTDPRGQGVTNFLCDVWNFGIRITINLSLSKLSRKNPIRSVVSWYKMNFMVYFEF